MHLHAVLFLYIQTFLEISEFITWMFSCKCFEIEAEIHSL